MIVFSFTITAANQDMFNNTKAIQFYSLDKTISSGIEIPAVFLSGLAKPPATMPQLYCFVVSIATGFACHFLAYKLNSRGLPNTRKIPNARNKAILFEGRFRNNHAAMSSNMIQLKGDNKIEKSEEAN